MSRSFSFVGGAESHVYLLAIELAKLGSEVFIASQALNDGEMMGSVNGIDIFRFNYQDFQGSTLRLRRIIQRQSIDVIHAHDALSTLVAASVRRSLSIPLIRTDHDFSLTLSSKDTRGRVADFLAAEVSIDAVIAVSNYGVGELKKIGFDARKIHLIHNGIDIERFTPDVSGERVRSLFHLDKENTLITCAARMSEEKGIDVLIKAIPEVLAKFPNAKFLVTGNGSIFQEHQSSMKGDLDDLIREFGIQDSVLFGEGRFSYQEMPEVYNASDIVVVASRYGEMFGMAAAEAMACGRPVIASRICALPEVVGSDKYGILFKSEDSKALAKQIRRLLAYPKLGEALGNNARERVIKRFNVKRMAQETLGLYEQIHKAYD